MQGLPPPPLDRQLWWKEILSLTRPTSAFMVLQRFSTSTTDAKKMDLCVLQNLVQSFGTFNAHETGPAPSSHTGQKTQSSET